MKCWVLFCLFLAPCAHGQASSRLLGLLAHATSEPFRGANAVVLHTRDSATAVYGEVARALRADGFALERTNPARGILETASRRLDGDTMTTALQFFVVPAPGGALLVVQGSYYAASFHQHQGHASVSAPIGNVGPPGSAPQRAWAEMLRACQLYPHGTLAYLDSHKRP
ncbi:MAG: hypothetical protein JWR44_1751 [Hymenobacter sp.]|nr:hypothetical protein [Hymenobacter sp.]